MYIFIVILASFSYQTLRCTIPARTYIFCKRVLVVDTATRTKISQFNCLLSYEDIFWLDITVKYAIFVHVCNSFQ
jgi:hypothetical protein